MDASNTKKNASIRQKMVGFTLIELSVTLAVVAITAVIAVPAFQSFMMNARMSTQVDGLVDALNDARSTALSQIIPVTFCPFSALNLATCGTNWSAGWIIATKPPLGSPVLIQSRQSRSNGPILTAAGVSSITFTARGLPNNSANFKFCDGRGSNFARSVEVLLTGFVQAGQTVGQAVWDGSALTCP